MKIRLPQTPNIKEGVGFQQIDPSTGSAPFRALEGLGKQVSEGARTLQAFEEKRKKQKAKSAQAKMSLEAMRAKSEVDDFIQRNPNKPGEYEKFAQDRFKKVLDEVDRKGLDPEDLEALNNQFKLESERAKIQAKHNATKREIAIGNGNILELSEAQFRAGEVDKSWQTLQEASLPEEELAQRAEEIYGAGMWDLAREDLNEAERLGIEGVDAYIEQLQGKKPPEESPYDFGIYENYEAVVNGQPIAGLDPEQRKRLVSWAKGRKRSLQVQAQKDIDNALAAIQRDEDVAPYLANPDIPEDKAEWIRSVQAAELEGQGEGSPAYENLADEISSAITDVQGGDPVEESAAEDLWKRVREGDLTRTAKIELGQKLAQLDSWRVQEDKNVLKKRSFGFDKTEEISVPERRVKQELINMTDGVFRMIKERPAQGRSPESVSRGYLDTMDEIERDVDSGRLTEDNVDEYIERKLPRLYEANLQKPVEKQVLDELEAAF